MMTAEDVYKELLMLRGEVQALRSERNTLSDQIAQAITQIAELRDTIHVSERYVANIPARPVPDGDFPDTANESIDHSPSVGDPNTNTAEGTWQLKDWHAPGDTLPVTNSTSPYQPGSGSKILRYRKLVRMRLYGTRQSNEANVHAVINTVTGEIEFPTEYVWVMVEDSSAAVANLDAELCTGLS